MNIHHAVNGITEMVTYDWLRQPLVSIFMYTFPICGPCLAYTSIQYFENCYWISVKARLPKDLRQFAHPPSPPLNLTYPPLTLSSATSTTFRFVACALPVCRCWSVLVPFGRGREPTTSSTKIMAEWRWLRRPLSGSQRSMPLSSLSHSSTSSPG